uniref:Uncharacterized protein n=1 Tax=Chlamydomonas leiostraca TaxID=1034604 RepID=A0A7S0S4Y7_9CHLO|mmetsp:Transcript_5506/g.13643  ORF Transcript_5506/g.13643 Transcript_5506/m.13643 type:complete len:133 (+) Transcript_5506:125-523(+)
MSWAQAARSAAMAALRGCRTQSTELFQQQTRKMGGGGGGGPWYRSYDGKPPPAEFQSPDFVTYAGLTLPKRAKDVDYFYTKAVGSLVWFTMIYNFSLNWEEHWYGDIWVFEKDVQANGWDDDHGHGHGKAHH